MLMINKYIKISGEKIRQKKETRKGEEEIWKKSSTFLGPYIGYNSFVWDPEILQHVTTAANIAV